MQKDVMRMRQVRLVLQTRQNMSDRVSRNQVVMMNHGRIDTGLVTAVVTQPVLHADAKPGMIANHMQRALPEVQALRQRAHANATYMMLQKKCTDRITEDQENCAQRNDKHRCAHERCLAGTEGKGEDKERCDRDSYPGPERLTQIEYQQERYAEGYSKDTQPPCFQD